MFRLEGKVAVVTGCNSGLGQGMAVALAKAGADIVGVGRKNSGNTESEVLALGKKFVFVEADLLSIEPVQRIVHEAIAAFGRMDILVNNAGIIRREDTIKFGEQDWDDVMNTNLKVPMFLSQAIAAKFIEQGGGGKIINIASMLSFQGGIRVPSYTSSKSGLLGLTRLMANEWSKYGINVNAIAPGYMATDNTKDLRTDAQRNADILNRIPAGRWGKAEDLDGSIVFLASSASDYVTGHTIAVDGGWLAR